MPLKIVKTTVTLTATGAGYSDVVALPALRRRGQILRVMLREDGTLKEMTNGSVVITEDAHPIDADTLGEERIYTSTPQAFAGGSPVAELDDNAANTGGVYYDCGVQLYAALNVVAAAGAGGSTLCALTVWALVEH